MFFFFFSKQDHLTCNYLQVFLMLDFLLPFGSYAGRPPSASTATGNKHHHNSEQEDLINQALD